MKNELKVYVVGPQTNYANFIFNHELVDNIKDADIVLFTGGEDVDPHLYHQEPHYTTFYNPERDKFEVEEFNKINKDQIAIGVCRGSQFLCVMNGGKLIQNVSNHAIFHTHLIYSNDIAIDITSTHHQMQYPFNINKDYYDILFWARHLSSDYEGDGIDPDKVEAEPEIVFYHNPKLPRCLAIQGHPEYMRHESPAVIEINKIIKNIVNHEI